MLVDRCYCHVCNVRYKVTCRHFEDQVLQDHGAALPLERDAILFAKSDHAAHVFIVTQGCLKLFQSQASGRTQITGFAYPGHFIGYLGESVYPLSATAVVASRVCRFPRETFFELVSQYAPATDRLMRMAFDDLAATRDHLLIISRKSASSRVAMLLAKFSELSPDANDSIQIELPMCRADMADYLALTKEAVSRGFRVLHRQRMINILSPRRILIPCRSKLIEAC